MALDIQQLACAHVRELEPYQSARRIGGHGHTFLNANESPRSELYFFNSTTLNRYPDCQPLEVVQGYADYVGLRRDEVLVTRGSDEAIGLIVRTFCEIGEGIVIAPPTYGMYAIAARTNRAQVFEAEREAGFKLSAQCLIDACDKAPFKVKAVFIDSPANPLGEIFPREELLKLLEALPETLIVMDEAYIEFSSAASSVGILREHPNLIVLRTLSKAFALAGIRCGFALAHPDIVALMTKVIDPYPIPDPVAQIARQAVARGGIELMCERVKGANERRETLRGHLKALPIVEEIFPSEANFLLVRFKDGPAVFGALAQKGIILRSFENRKGLHNCVRISIGSAEELDEVMRTLTALAGGEA